MYIYIYVYIIICIYRHLGDAQELLVAVALVTHLRAILVNLACCNEASWKQRFSLVCLQVQGSLSQATTVVTNHSKAPSRVDQVTFWIICTVMAWF